MDGLWVLRLLKPTGWLPAPLHAASELLHALPNQEAAAVLLAQWRSVQPAVNSFWPLEPVGARIHRGMAKQLDDNERELSTPEAVKQLLLSLLHSHFEVAGAQYGRFVEELEGQAHGPKAMDVS